MKIVKNSFNNSHNIKNNNLENKYHKFSFKNPF